MRYFYPRFRKDGGFFSPRSLTYPPECLDGRFLVVIEPAIIGMLSQIIQIHGCVHATQKNLQLLLIEHTERGNQLASSPFLSSRLSITAVNFRKRTAAIWGLSSPKDLRRTLRSAALSACSACSGK